MIKKNGEDGLGIGFIYSSNALFPGNGSFTIITQKLVQSKLLKTNLSHI